MARNIDLSKVLSEEDEAYLAHRPWLKRDWELQGGTLRFASQGHTEEVEEEVGEEEDVVTYTDFTVQELKDEIEHRNSGREDDAKIEPSSNKKADLIAALEADDAADPEESSDEDTSDE